MRRILRYLVAAVETMKKHAEDFDELTLVLFGEREFGFAVEMFPEFILPLV